MDTASRGWVKWQGQKIVDARIKPIKDAEMLPHRLTLGDNDEELWEKGPDGQPRDPWAHDYRLVLVEMTAPHGEFTFCGSSYGARIAMQELCNGYSLDAVRYTDAWPVVSLGVNARKTTRYGVIKGPRFVIEGWAHLADVKAGKKTLAQPRKIDMADELNDELPL
jgi:hypothetical protein